MSRRFIELVSDRDECAAEHDDMGHVRQCALPARHVADHEDVVGNTWVDGDGA